MSHPSSIPRWDKPLSFWEYVRIHTEPSKSHTTDVRGKTPKFLLELNGCHLFVYCCGNDTLAITDVDSYPGGGDPGAISLPYTIAKLKPAPNFGVERVRSFDRGRKLLLWGPGGVCFLECPAHLHPPTGPDPSRVVARTRSLVEDTPDRRIIKCDTWSCTTPNGGHAPDPCIVAYVTDANKFYVHEVSCTGDQTQSFLDRSLVYSEHLAAPSTNHDDNYDEGIGTIFSRQSSTLSAALNINAALGESFIDFVIGPASSYQPNHTLLNVLFLEGTGSISAVTYNLAVVPNVTAASPRIKFSRSHSFYVPYLPADDNYDPDMEYVSLTYLPLGTPDLVVILQKSTDPSSPASYDRTTTDIVVRHCAILTSPPSSDDNSNESNVGKLKLYVLESLAVKLPPSTTTRPGISVETSGPTAVVLRTCDEGRATDPILRYNYALVTVRDDYLFTTVTISLPWIRDIKRLFDIFLPAAPDVRTGSESRQRPVNELLNLVTYNVPPKSALKLCHHAPDRPDKQYFRGCCYLSAAKKPQLPLPGPGSDRRSSRKHVLVQLVSTAKNGSELEDITDPDPPYDLGDGSLESELTSRLIALFDRHNMARSSHDADDLVTQILSDSIYESDSGTFYGSVKRMLSVARGPSRSGKNGGGEDRQWVEELRGLVDKVERHEKILYEIETKKESLVREMKKQKGQKLGLLAELDSLALSLRRDRERWEGMNAALADYFKRISTLVEKSNYLREPLTTSTNDAPAAANLATFRPALRELGKRCGLLLNALSKTQEIYVKLEMAASPFGTDTPRLSRPPAHGRTAREEEPLSRTVKMYGDMVRDQDEAIHRLVYKMNGLGIRLATTASHLR